MRLLFVPITDGRGGWVVNNNVAVASMQAD